MFEKVNIEFIKSGSNGSTFKCSYKGVQFALKIVPIDIRDTKEHIE